MKGEGPRGLSCPGMSKALLSRPADACQACSLPSGQGCWAGGCAVLASLLDTARSGADPSSKGSTGRNSAVLPKRGKSTKTKAVMQL